MNYEFQTVSVTSCNYIKTDIELQFQLKERDSLKIKIFNKSAYIKICKRGNNS